MFSFYFVAQWAAAFNDREFSGDSSRGIPYSLSKFRSLLAKGDGLRLAAIHDVRYSNYRKDSHGQFLGQFIPFLNEWYISLAKANQVWYKKFKSTSHEDGSPEKRSGTHSTLFRELTNQLVIDTLKIAHEHLSKLSEVEAADDDRVE
jgi:hypothetical protein